MDQSRRNCLCKSMTPLQNADQEHNTVQRDTYSEHTHFLLIEFQAERTSYCFALRRTKHTPIEISNCLVKTVQRSACKTNNATYDNRNLNKTTQNCLLLICISYCLLKEDKLQCGIMINAIPKRKFIYLRKLL